jgi:CubicO group peptidase (beta-lactamase class C family)
MSANTYPNQRRLILASLIFLLSFIIASGCSPQSSEGEVEYAPLDNGEWMISSPEEVGLNPRLLERFFEDAAEMETLYGLLVVKDGSLIAEQYFNGGSIDRRQDLASVTKSFTSALMGIAFRECDLEGIDQKMIEFFPEYADQLEDPRKSEITLENMLKMRSGYPWEEFTPPYMNQLFRSPRWIGHIVDFPLTSDPGTQFGYSNLTAHLTGVVVAKSCGQSLYILAEDYLMEPIDGEMGAWTYDPSGFNYGSGALALTARDAARFGLLYLNGGRFQDEQIIPSEWVEASLARYSTGIYGDGLGGYLKDLGYGYFWWSASVGKHDFNYAWGHGGNLIVLVHDLDMVIVTTADILPGMHGEESWKREGAIIDVVGKFIKSLPAK